MHASVNDPVLTFTIMVAATLLAPFLAAKLRIPDMVLLLIAGAALGPNGAGLLERNSAILLFGSVGMIYLMFLAGLEIDLHRFIRARRRSIIFGLLTFALPQGIGTLLGRYVLSMDWPAAILLASMFASHTLLAYPVASRLGITSSEPVAITIGATIITDVLALLVLAVIADFSRGVELTGGFWAILLASLFTLIALGWWGIPWLSRWFFRHNGENGSGQFLFVIGMVCAFAYGSHFARMEPIIGAFLAGIAFNRMIPQQSTLMNRVEFVGHTVFIPFFLISVGMLLNPAAVATNPESWVVAAIMVGAVIITKYGAAHIACRLFGYSSHEGQVMFGLSVVQAAATLAAVLVGFELGIFDDAVLNGAIAMILVTCPLGAWAVDRYGREMAAQAEDAQPARKVDQRLLIPIANPAGATRLLDLAFVLRDLSIPSIIHPVTIIPDGNETTQALAAGEKLMAQCLNHASAVEVPISPGVRIGMNVGDGIVRAAREMRADIAMFGWSEDKTVASRIFGSVRHKMLQECPSRLMFCRLVTPLNTTKRLLLPLPPQSGRRSDLRDLLEEAKRLAKQLGADLCVYVGDPAFAAKLRGMIDETAPAMPFQFIESPDWPAARERFLEEIQPDDMALLPLERRVGALWTPSLDRLPDIVAERFPGMNMIAAYPALRASVPEYAFETPQESEARSVIPIALPGTPSLESIFACMARNARLWNRVQQQEIQKLLLDSAQAYPVEMSPGTVLLHAHTEDVAATTILAAYCEQPCRFPGIDRDTRCIVALISPREQTPKRHLAALATLARVFHKKDIVDQIAQATSSEKIAQLLADAMG